MLLNFTKWFANLFVSNRESNLEVYINSKNPKSPADVEHWLVEYDNEQRFRARFIADNGF